MNQEQLGVGAYECNRTAICRGILYEWHTVTEYEMSQTIRVIFLMIIQWGRNPEIL
jgi:hypothetical protein